MSIPPHHPRTLYRGARVIGTDVARGAIGVEAGRIVFVGTDDAADGWIGTGDGAPHVVDLHGTLIGPAFVDSHVHTVRTGFMLTGLDLTTTTTLDGALDALASHAAARPRDGVLVGQGWDETNWPEALPPTGAELERAAPSRRSYLTRVDSHSSVISPALAALVPGIEQLDGWTPDGRVERDAHHAVRVVLENLLSDDDRLGAAQAACRAMAAQGVASFHENAAPHIGPESEIALVRRAAEEAGLRAVVYWGELMAVETARRLGVAGLAGDLIADGALGSRTAALRAPYDDAPHTCGHAYVSPEQVRDHVVACTRAGLQAGFHCIGDAALDAIGEGFRLAAEIAGADAVRAAHHRLEHVEMPSTETIGVLGALGVVLSVQPMFDALWGGPDSMYADRLGQRWRETNPLRDLVHGGLQLAFGSDSPVTPVGPWEAVRAATHHHAHEQRLTSQEAFRAHTRGSSLAARWDTDGGTLLQQAPADLAVWDVPGGLDDDGYPTLGSDVALPRLVRLVVAGHTVHDPSGHG